MSWAMGVEIVGNECDADGAMSDGMMGAHQLGGGAWAPADSIAHVMADSCHSRNTKTLLVQQGK